MNKVVNAKSPALVAFGEKARMRRKGRGMSQRGVAKIAGTTQSTVANIEAGSANPTVKTIEAIARALGADLKVDFQMRSR